MIQRVRLQRKFTLKHNLDTASRLAHIAQMMVVFELAFVSLAGLCSLSMHFHLQHLYTTEFWTSQAIINSNLSLAITIFLLLPYLVFYVQVSTSAVKDFVATAITIHFLFSLAVNLKLSLGYLLFVGVAGLIGGVLGSYGAVLREQKKLIDEIQIIEGADRKEQHLTVEQCEREHLHVPDN